MNNCDKIRAVDYVYDLWYVHRLTFEQIADMDIPSVLSMKRISNIVYGGPQRCCNNHERNIYSLYRTKFLETQSVRDALQFVFLNQPPVRICANTARNYVKHKLKLLNKAKEKNINGHVSKIRNSKI